MRSMSVRALESQAEHLHGEQREVQGELREAERRSDEAALRHGQLMDRLRGLPSDADPRLRSDIERRIREARDDWQRAQQSLAELESRQEAIDREIASVTADAMGYLGGVDGSIETARGASDASPYGEAAILRLISSFESNKAAARRVLALFDQSAGVGSAGLGVGGGETGGAIPFGHGREGLLHLGPELTEELGFLPQTRQGRQAYRDPESGRPRNCFDDPWGTGERLNHRQGAAVDGFAGTCGLVSCQNIARLAGKDVSEADVIRLAMEKGLCSFDPDDAKASGGITSIGQQKLLTLLGIDSYFETEHDPEVIAEAVESGRGVIAAVHAGFFWGEAKYDGPHTITITSTERDANDELRGFYVCDSGTDEAARLVSANFLEASLCPGDPLNVTSGPIR